MARPAELEEPKSLNLRMEAALYDTLVQLTQHPKMQAAVRQRITHIRKKTKDPASVRVSQGDVLGFLVLTAGEQVGIGGGE